jgi:hypothetical protein
MREMLSEGVFGLDRRYVAIDDGQTAHSPVSFEQALEQGRRRASMGCQVDAADQIYPR